MIRALIKAIAPTALTDRVRGFLLANRAGKLQMQSAGLTSVDDIIDLAFGFGVFTPNQVRSEVTALLNVLSKDRPRRVLEIGSEGGGNLFLLSKLAAPDAHILSIDLNFSAVQLAAYPSLASHTQALACFKGDSHSPEMLRRVTEWLGGERFDFIFIDGDHSLAGATADFEMYAPLVKPGGLVGFHDIVPDHTTRFGRKTMAYAGDAPILWKQLKDTYPDHQEFVANPEQDGAGIGLLRWDGQLR